MKLFVWDFHGVLEIGNEVAVVEISNGVLESFGYKERFSLEDVKRLYGKKWHEYFEDLLPEEKPRVWGKLQEACFEFQEKESLILETIKPTPYSHIILEEIAQNHYQVLMSNTNPETFPLFLNATGIDRYFTIGVNAFPLDSHRRENKLSKKPKLKEFLEQSETDFDKIIVIGDASADIEMVSFIPKEKRTTYLYSHPGIAFREEGCNPDYKIRDLREILKEI